MSRQSLTTRCPTPLCALDVVNGSMQACSSNSRPRHLPPSTGSSASTSTMSPCMARCTRRPMGAREPAPIQRIGPSSAGSGRSPPSVTAYRWAGRSTAPTTTTVAMAEPTIDAIDAAGLLDEIGTLHLDRAYDSGAVRDRLPAQGIAEFEIQHRGTKIPGVKKQPLRLGLRWIVVATNTSWSKYGQLRRSTDRRARHRHAALCLVTTVLIVGRLIDWRDRWR